MAKNKHIYEEIVVIRFQSNNLLKLNEVVNKFFFFKKNVEQDLDAEDEYVNISAVKRPPLEKEKVIEVEQ